MAVQHGQYNSVVTTSDEVAGGKSPAHCLTPLPYIEDDELLAAPSVDDTLLESELVMLESELDAVPQPA